MIYDLKKMAEDRVLVNPTDPVHLLMLGTNQALLAIAERLEALVEAVAKGNELPGEGTEG